MYCNGLPNFLHLYVPKNANSEKKTPYDYDTI